MLIENLIVMSGNFLFMYIKNTKYKTYLVLHTLSFVVAILLFGNVSLHAQWPGLTLTEPQPILAGKVNSWTIETKEMKISVGATHDGQLVIYELINLETGWNWVKEPSVFHLPKSANTGGPLPELIKWSFVDGNIDNSEGQKLTLWFNCENPKLRLESTWLALDQTGPIRHKMSITNLGDEIVGFMVRPASIYLNIEGPENNPLYMWTFHSDGGTPDYEGTSRYVIEPPQKTNFNENTLFSKEIITAPDGQYIPYSVIESAEKHGIYIGMEWSYCSIEVVSLNNEKPGTARIRGQMKDRGFSIESKETFEVPPCLIGLYAGDLDDAGNQLRKWLFKYNIPEVIRQESTYPKVQWNAFTGTSEKPGEQTNMPGIWNTSWKCLESKYYPSIDIIAPIGFEEVMIDVGWWEGGTSASEPKPDPVRWPSGMIKAADYTHKSGLRLGLYWNKGEEMADKEGRDRRIRQIKQLFSEYNADAWRSDVTGGPVVSANYSSVKGFYNMLEQMGKEIPDFHWENCSGGGRIKDFGAMKYATKIQSTDTYANLHIRQAFYDMSFMYPPVQIMSPVMDGVCDLKYSFRSGSLGAIQIALSAFDWSSGQREELTGLIKTYKTRIRPLIRTANLFHIFPRPDDMNWDGIEYFDPLTHKGVVFVFRPNTANNSETIRLKGLDTNGIYEIAFEDGSNPLFIMAGAQLTDKGFNMILEEEYSSELIWIRRMNK